MLTEFIGEVIGVEVLAWGVAGEQPGRVAMCCGLQVRPRRGRPGADRAAVRVRDCAFRDPAGNLIRINELR